MEHMYSCSGIPVYRQGEKILEKIGDDARKLGTCAFILGGEKALGAAKDRIDRSLRGAGIRTVYQIFHGTCSPENVTRYLQDFRQSGAQFVIGVGGGKVMDTTKSIALLSGAPFLLAPTSAAQCACCANVIILYDENGDNLEYCWNLDHAAAAILVDTDIIGRHCPARMLACGVSDSIAKLPEIEFLRQTTDSWKTVCPSDYSYLVAREIYQLYLKEAAKAYQDVTEGILSKEVEDVIAANILLTGMSSILACGTRQIAYPHNVYYSVCRFNKETQKKYMHGEIVSAALLLQFEANGAAPEVVRECRELLESIHAATCPADLGIQMNRELLGTWMDFCESRMQYLTLEVQQRVRSIAEAIWI